MSIPPELKYTKDHEWARPSGSDGITIGITAFAVEQLGDITLIELPEVGAELEEGQTFGTVESVKSVSDLYSPVTGRVVKVNTYLEDQPELVNDSPYDKGWLITVAADVPADALLSADEYAAVVAEAQ